MGREHWSIIRTAAVVRGSQGQQKPESRGSQVRPAIQAGLTRRAARGSRLPRLSPDGFKALANGRG